MKRGITLCLLSSLALVAQAHEAAEGVIKERMDRFKENKESKKSIKANLGGDASIIAKEALAIQDWANQMTNFFPEGSTQSPSEALRQSGKILRTSKRAPLPMPTQPMI